MLGWLKKSQKSLKQYVGNRVKIVQWHRETTEWLYIPSDQNPARIAATGTTAAELINKKLWWNGPSCIKQEATNWPQTITHSTEELMLMQKEERSIKVAAVTVSQPWIENKFSTFTKLRVVTAYVMRFITNCRKKMVTNKNMQPKRAGVLITADQVEPATLRELVKAELFWYRKIQESAYSNELKACRDKINLPKGSKLISLQPSHFART